MGDYIGTTIGDIKVDTRSSDYSSLGNPFIYYLHGPSGKGALVSPDANAFNAALGAFARVGRWESVLEVLQELGM